MTTSSSQEAQQSQTRNEERSELIRRTICPRGISEDEFLLFMEQCRRSGLDPLLKEAFCVPRRAKVSRNGRDEWVTKHEFQPSEAGMLARAERFPDFHGIQASAAFSEDEIIVDQGKGEVVHRFNPAKRKGSLVGAWARVVRDGKLPVVVWLDFSGYVQQTPLWSKIPGTMIEKCARVAALRKAYPETFGGLYIREEMPAEEDASPGTAARSLPAKTATRESLDVAASAFTSPRSSEVVDANYEESVSQDGATREAPPASPTPTAPASAALVAFGPHKGKTASELSDAALTETIDLANEKLMAEPNARWAKAMRENLAVLEGEAELRCRVPATDTPPSPAPAAPPEPTTGTRSRRAPPASRQRMPGEDDGDESPAAP